MALADVDRILEGLKIAGAQHAQTQQAQLEQQRQDIEKEYRQKDLDARIQQHRDTTAYQQAVLKATAAHQKVQSLQIEQGLAKSYQQGEALVPGARVVGTRTDESGNTFHTIQWPDEFGQQQQQVTIPGVIGQIPGEMGPMTSETLSPESYAKQQAAYNEQLEGPKRETTL